jgi:uncharacterized protein (TIGR02118 family)
MQVRMGLLNKPEDWSLARFRQHWREHHAQLARQLPGLRHYQQNHVVDSAQRGIQYARGPEQLDGISQLAFDDDEAMRAAFATDVGPKLVADENHFIGRLRIVTVTQHVVVEPPMPGTALKRMSLLRRREDVSPEQFAHEWQAVHGPLVKRLPGVLGYRQNLITQRQSPKGTVVGHDGLPVDGIVELWFASTDSLDAAFASPVGREAMAHATTFIAEITTFLVDEVVVV